MANNKLAAEQNHSFPEKKKFCENRTCERRKKEDQGYIYITTVGWICRRDICRRQKDKLQVTHGK